MRMESVDCGLGETATISGLGAFPFAVRAASAPTEPLPGAACRDPLPDCRPFHCLVRHLALTLARTIADLAGAEMIAALHLDEALQFRPSVEAG
ncbi:MAG TPA: hypothetical protein VKC57_00940 [Ktedonobacterales bacterium]|nr:hypothetical protein [Ktedonobacterales bacterium]